MKYIISIIVIIISLSVLSCSNSTEPEKSAKDYAEEGWKSFDEQDYESAEKSFAEALKLDGKSADAYAGSGWSIAYQKRYSEAVSQWRSGIYKDAANADIYAGLTVVYQALDSLKECVAAGDKLTAMDSGYQFLHDEKVNIALIHGLLASAHYGLQEYDYAASEMDLAVPANAPHRSDDLKALLDSIMDFLGLQ